MFGSFHIILLAIIVPAASERAGQNGDDKGTQPPLDETVAQALQTHVPNLKDQTAFSPTGWFSPTGRELSDTGILKHSIDNIRKQAAAMKEHADNVIDAAHTHGEELKSFGDVLEKADGVRKQLDEKSLSQLLDLDDKRMKWSNRMLGDESRYPTESDLLDYMPLVESISESDERGRLKEDFNEDEAERKLWADYLGLSVKDLPFRDLLYPHEPTHSRMLEDYRSSRSLLPGPAQRDVHRHDNRKYGEQGSWSRHANSDAGSDDSVAAPTDMDSMSDHSEDEGDFSTGEEEDYS